jgi:regulatory protein
MPFIYCICFEPSKNNFPAQINFRITTIFLLMLQKKPLLKEEALQKIKQYCSYQERCHKEVKHKLYNYGLFKREVEEIIAVMVENNYLNEERFAIEFAGGKFRMKQWGRKKIQYELHQKGVSAYCISIALQQLEEDDYVKSLQKLALNKWNNLAKEPALTRYSKTYGFLVLKGFEPALVSRVIKQIQSGS